MIGLIALMSSGALGGSYTWQDIVQPNFKDCTFTAKVVKSDQKELAKINKDFGMSFRFSSMNAEVKEPFMVKLESKAEGTTVQYIENDGRLEYRIVKLHLGKVENVADAPGKQQLVMEFGIFDAFFV